MAVFARCHRALCYGRGDLYRQNNKGQEQERGILFLKIEMFNASNLLAWG